MPKMTDKQIDALFLEHADNSLTNELTISQDSFKEAMNKAFSLKDVVNLCCENSQKHNDLLKDEFKDTVCKCGNKMV